MAEKQQPLAGTRHERRKAATRAKIEAAAEALFAERGYAETSVEDISEAADVAMRTIYTHFPSKAAIMLAYFDRWMDAFIAEILRRPIDEPVVETVRESLLALGEAGWVDRVENDDVRVHPLVEHLASGSPDIAGHVMQRWMQESGNLTNDFIRRGSFPTGSLEPHARAIAVFSAWVAALSVAGGRDHGRPVPHNATGGSLGLEVLALITSGKL